MANLIYTRSLSDANEVKATYTAIGYDVRVNVNHAAFIHSSERSQDLFVVVITKR